MERSDSRYRLREGQQATQKTGSPRACNKRGADLEIVRSTRVLNDCLVVALVENLTSYGQSTDSEATLIERPEATEEKPKVAEGNGGAGSCQLAGTCLIDGTVWLLIHGVQELC